MYQFPNLQHRSFQQAPVQMVLLLFIFMLGAGSSAAWADDGHYPTGLVGASEEDREWVEQHVIKVDPEALLSSAVRAPLPSKVVNIEYLPKVGRQAWGACAAWASTYYYKTWQEAKEHNWKRPDPAVDPEHIMSPAFSFNLYNGGHDVRSSTTLNDPLLPENTPSEYRYLTLYGAAPVSEMDANAPPYALPSADQIYSAFPYRADQVFLLEYASDAGFEALKNHLASGDLATISMALNNNFASYPTDGPGVNSEVLFDNDGGLYSDWCDVPPCNPNHALTVIGYDDNKAYTGTDGQQHYGAMLLVNSWGTGWGTFLPEAGERGFIWLGYDFFRNHTAQSANYMTDRINYQPTLVGSYGIQHERRGELDIKVMAGDPDNPDWEMDVLPFAGGDVRLDQVVPFDATDFSKSTDVGWWLSVRDMDLPGLWYPPKTGTITSFDIKRMDGRIWASADAPVDTVDFNYSDPDTFHRRLNVSLVDKVPEAIVAATPGESSHVWADFDGDGDFDLLIFDRPADYTTTQCHLLSNEGSNDLVNRGCSIPYLSGGDIAVADINGDGLIDVAINGYTEAGVTSTKVYYNTGDFLFNDSGISLPGSYGPLEWLDVNSDGRLDLSMLLDPSAYVREIGVMLQNPDGTFSPANLGLPEGHNFSWGDYNRDGRLDVVIAGYGYSLYYQDSNGSMTAGPVIASTKDVEVVAWGDVDNDGWLDMGITYLGSPDEGGGVIAEVWRNNHNGDFTLYSSFTDAPYRGGMSWGDVNNDGLSDMAIWGDFRDPQGRAGWNVQTRVMINNGDGSFTNGGFDLYGVYWLSNSTADLLRWIDYDGDGDLDFTVAGIGPQPDGWPRRFALYVNKAAQAEGFDRPNLPPQPPVHLSAIRAQPSDPITFTWSPGSDAETDAAGLYYNVRMGRNPSSGDILAPDYSAVLTNHGLHPTLDSNTLGLKLESPSASAFYWSVQSVDAGHAVSEWSPPQIFSSSPNEPPGDLNSDGIIDVADVMKTARMADGIDPVDTAKADRDGNGKVDERDTYLMEQILLGESTTDTNLIASATIGPDGGLLTTDEFTLVVPAGAFAENASLTLRAFGNDKPFAGATYSTLFQLNGLPTRVSSPLTVRVKSNAPVSGEQIYFALGQSSSAYESPFVDRHFSSYDAIDIGDGGYETQLPFQEETATGLAVRATSIGKTKRLPPVHIVLVDGWYRHTYESTHFQFIEEGVSVPSADLVHLAQSFEHAYNVLTAPPYSFKCKFNESGKVKVYIKEMDSSVYGEEQSSIYGDLENYINMNFDKLSDAAGVEQSAVHEFFHYIQDQYDPQTIWEKDYLGSTYLWLEEASSTWSEELAIHHDVPSSVLKSELWDSLRDGLHSGVVGNNSHRQSVGYGNAGLIKYISSLPGGLTNMRRIYEDVATQKNPISTVLLYMTPVSDNWGKYLVQLVTGQLYDFEFSDISNSGSFKYFISADKFRIAKSVDRSLPDLSGTLARPIFNSTALAALTDHHSLSTKLDIDDSHPDALQMFLIKVRDSGTGEAESELIGEAVKANGGLKFDVPGMKKLYDNGWQVRPLLVNRNAMLPYDASARTRLTMAITSDEEKILETMEIPGHSLYGSVPEMRASGSLKAAGWSDYEMVDFVPYSSSMVLPYLHIKVPGVTPLPMGLRYHVEILNGSKNSPPESDGSYTNWSTPHIQQYELSIYEFDKGQTEPDPVPHINLTSTDGNFIFEVSKDAFFATGTMVVRYQVFEQRYNSDGDPVGPQVIHDTETTILALLMNL